ncbi:hypothetical protein LPJ66_008343, partial [Kickxella alabastrina]
KSTAHARRDSHDNVEVEVIEIDSSSEEPTPTPTAKEQPKPAEHVAPTPVFRPSSKRREAAPQPEKIKSRSNSFATAAAPAAAIYASVPAPAAKPAAPRVPPYVQQPVHAQKSTTVHRPTVPQQPVSAAAAIPRQPVGTSAAPRSEGKDLLTAARGKLRSTSNTAALDARQPHVGIKEALKATGASVLKARPRMNRSSSASKVEPQPSTSRPHAPIHRPPPASAADIKTASQQKIHYGSAPTTSSFVPPPVQQTQVQQQQQVTGRGAPGHKQPRSRDRMRSTLHYDSYAALNQSYATIAPMPQLPVDPRAPTPVYAQYYPAQPQTHQYGQAMFVDPAGPQQDNVPQGAYEPSLSASNLAGGPQRSYGDQPLSPTQAKNLQQQQQYQTVPMGGNANNMYPNQRSSSMHAGAAPGPAASGYYSSH